MNNTLGANEDVEVPEQGSDEYVINAQGRLPIRNNMSTGGGNIPCKLSTNEIRVYIDLLNRAVNISDEDVRSALEGVQKSCPTAMKSLMGEKVV